MWKALEYYKKRLIGHSCGNLKDKNAETNLDSGHLACEVSKGKEDFSEPG